jgi:superfamily II DNA helicase RecQ
VVSIGLLEEFKTLQGRQISPTSLGFAEDQLDPLQLFKSYGQVTRAQPLDPGTDVLRCLLRDFLGLPNATFSSDRQREALLAMVLNLDPCLFLVLPTGGGKTTLFLLCASLRTSKITIVIVPLISLRENLLSKAHALGLKATEWEKDPSNSIAQYEGPHLVLVSAETAVTDAFTATMRDLGPRVTRVIFDEAHLIHTAKHYRGVLHEISRITLLGRPLVFTTATLSQRVLSGIREELLLAEEPRVIRQPINRPNLSYRVRTLPNRHSEKQNYQMVLKNALGFMEARRGQVICFFPYKNQVDRFTELFANDVTSYHASLTEAIRAQNLALFTSGQRPILAATSAIGAGFDFANVGYIVYFLGAWSLTDFVQGCGRAARTVGSKGYVHVFVKQNGSLLTDTPSGDVSKDSMELDLFRQWVQEPTCRRRLLNLTYDDRFTDLECHGDDELCDLCEKRQEALQAQGVMAREIRDQQALRFNGLKSYKTQWSTGQCLGCCLRELSGRSTSK